MTQEQTDDTEFAGVNHHPELVIDFFDDFLDGVYGKNEYAFLSNFYQCPRGVPYGGVVFQTSEHAFHWAKVDRAHPDASDWCNAIATAVDADLAKMLGRSCPMTPDWPVIRWQVMVDVVWAKFANDSSLAERLVNTGHAYLQEGTMWDDLVWGVDLYTSSNPWKREGRNWLGHILMGARARMHAENAIGHHTTGGE